MKNWDDMRFYHQNTENCLAAVFGTIELPESTWISPSEHLRQLSA